MRSKWFWDFFSFFLPQFTVCSARFDFEPGQIECAKGPSLYRISGIRLMSKPEFCSDSLVAYVEDAASGRGTSSYQIRKRGRCDA